jgi:uncharacterized protein
MRLALAFALGATLACGAALAADVPYLTGRVVDNAEILSADAERRIAARLKGHEDRTTDQIAVLTVPTLDGESIEEFAVKVFEGWKLGQRDKDNGVLVVVAPRERRMRIEVGYGLEGTLTDAHASRIVRDAMTPRFKSGDFDGGVEAGVAAIIARLTGDAAAAPPPEQARSEPQSLFDSGTADLPLAARILIGAFVFGIVGLFTLVGVATPGVGWFLYLFLIPFWAIFPMMIVGDIGALWLLGIYLVAYPIAKLAVSRSDWYRRAEHEIRTKGRTTIGGFTLGSSGGGWSSGGSSGGFSGGGGSSGGGGASGSW